MTNQLLFTALCNNRQQTRGDITKGKEQLPCPLAGALLSVSKVVTSMGRFATCLCPMHTMAVPSPAVAWGWALGLAQKCHLLPGWGCKSAGCRNSRIEASRHRVKETTQFYPICQNPTGGYSQMTLYWSLSTSIFCSSPSLSQGTEYMHTETVANSFK